MYYSNDKRSFLSSVDIKNDTIIEIGCFAVLWGRVEYCFFENFYKDQKLDGIAAELQNKMDWAEWYDKIIETVQNWDPHVNNIDIFISRLRPNASFKNKLKLILDNRNPNNEEKIWVSLYVCSRIRNNMFHGEKDEWKLNKQKDLFATINDFLSELLNINQCYHIKTTSTI